MWICHRIPSTFYCLHCFVRRIVHVGIQNAPLESSLSFFRQSDEMMIEVKRFFPSAVSPCLLLFVVGSSTERRVSVRDAVIPQLVRHLTISSGRRLAQHPLISSGSKSAISVRLSNPIVQSIQSTPTVYDVTGFWKTSVINYKLHQVSLNIATFAARIIASRAKRPFLTRIFSISFSRICRPVEAKSTRDNGLSIRLRS